jgi:hypothetical protein
MRRSGPTRHPFVADEELEDPLSREQWCMTCNLPASNAVHTLPERSDEERAVEDRRYGGT